MSNFQDALRAERLELIRAVLQLQAEYYMLHGRWPSAEEIAAHLKV